MKVLVIPDIHLKPWIFDKVEVILNKYKIDKAVFIGDLVDDWNKESYIDLYKDTIDRAMLFKNTYKESIFCYGNHEVAYIVDSWCSGNSELFRPLIKSMLNEYEKAVEPVLAIKIDNVVFSHAGIANSCEVSYDIDTIDQVRLATAYNDTDSPLWVRPDPWITFCKDYTQVVGHSPVKKITKHNNVWLVDTFSTCQNGAAYGDETFLVIDTKTADVIIYK